MWKKTVAIHNILKEKNYKAKFLTNSIKYCRKKKSAKKRKNEKKK
jgi:hypothetical protein